MNEVFACSETPPAFLAPESIAPLCIDLFCGLGGWTEGFLAEGYRVVGFDIEIRPYPAQLVIQDVLTIHGSQFSGSAVIVASPPCQAYSYRAMPWKKAKALPPPNNALFEACFRIQREAIEATRRACRICNGCGASVGCPFCQPDGKDAGRYIPLIVENVRGAQPWVGRSAWNFGSFHLWGDVPALMPFAMRAVKVGGRGLKEALEMGTPANDFFHIPHELRGSENQMTRAERDGTKNGSDWFGSGADCSLQRRASSGSQARKNASALVAKIPFELARHVAAVYYPGTLGQALRPQGAAGETMK